MRIAIGGVKGMSRLLSFVSDEGGAVTVEFVTLVPAFVLLLVFFTDASIIYLTRSEMWNVARDVTRRMTTDEITTPAQVKSYVEQHLLLYGPSYLVTPSFESDMSVRISVGIGDAAIFGAWLGPVIGQTLTTSVTMRREPLE